MRSIETEKNETQRICVVCFDNYQKAKNATTNVKSGLTNGSTLHKRVTRDALKLIGLFTACILILSVALFFAIRNRSNNKKAAAANISGAMDASGKPAKAGDKLTSGEIGQSGNAATKKANNNSGSSNGSETVSKTAVKSDASAAGAKIADPKTKSTVTNAPNASASTDPKGTRHDLEKAANIKEKTALTNEKDNSPKVAKDGIAKDASGTPIADKKTDGSDTKKTDVLQTEPTKAASATDTVKEIEKLLPVDEKKGASKTADANTENSSDNTSPEKTATPGGRNRSSNHDFSKPTISKEKALEMNGKLSGIAAKVAPKMKSAATIAGRITDVASHFAPKGDIAGPIERTTPRKNSNEEEGDINLDGGTGEDAWDALQREIAESDPTVAFTSPGSSTASAFSNTGIKTASGQFVLRKPQAKLAHTISTAPKSQNAAKNSKQKDTAKTNGVKKSGQLKSTDIVLNSLEAKPGKTTTLNSTDIILNDLAGKPGKVAKLNSTEIQLNSLSVGSPKKQSQLNSLDIKLNSTEIMLSPFTEIPTSKKQLNNTEIVLNSLTGHSSEQAKLNSTTILLRPLEEPNGAANTAALSIPQQPILATNTSTPPAPKIIVNRYVPLPDAFKGEIVIHTLSADTLFDTSATTLCKIAEDHLGPFAGGIKKHPELPILIRCYSDNIGTLKENLSITQKRAEAVRIWLIKKTGIPAKNISCIGMGSSEPIASNTYSDGTDNFQGRARNRRITITTPTLMPTRVPTPPVAPPLMVKQVASAATPAPLVTVLATKETKSNPPQTTNTPEQTPPKLNPKEAQATNNAAASASSKSPATTIATSEPL